MSSRLCRLAARLFFPIAAVIAVAVAAPRTVIAAADSVAVFNEIHYHPADPGDTEWIELRSLMGVDVDLSGWNLRGGVDFVFPEGTIIEGHGYLVVAADPGASSLNGVGALGPFSGALSNGGEALRLENRDGRVMDRVEYSDSGDWPVGPDGSGATLAKVDEETGDSRPANWAASQHRGGAPGRENFPSSGSGDVERVIFDWDATWRYNETDDLPVDWADASHPEGGSWQSGAGALGWESSPPPIPIGTELTQPAFNSPYVITYYFEREFTLTADQLARLTELRLEHLIDDGAIIYLNGQEVFRHRMPGGAVTSETTATGGGDPTPSGPIPIPAAALQAGANRISAEVHQESFGSSDVMFGLRLTAQEEPAGTSGAGGILFSEFSAFDDPGGFKLELANVSAAPFDPAGYEIIFSEGGAYVLGPEILNAGEFRVLDATALGFQPGNDDRLFLFGPDGSLIDARRVTGRLRGSSDEFDGAWLYPAQPTFGSPNVFAFESDIVISEIMYNPRPQPPTPDTPATYDSVRLLDWETNWRFNEAGSDLGAGWASAPHSVGGVWRQGAGPLGWENAATAVPIATVLTQPALNSPYVVTYYFETEFILTQQQLNSVTELQLTHLIDDGAIFYLNGQEIERFEMPAGAVTASTLATGGGESQIVGPIRIGTEALVAGANRLSVEVHQTSVGSSDVVFGLQLDAAAELTPFIPGDPFRNSDAQWLEIHNRSPDRTIDISGWRFDDGIDLEFPAGTTLAPGERTVVARDVQEFSAMHPGAPVVGDFSGNLSRRGERVRLVDAAGNPADEVGYSEGGRWPSLPDGEGASLELRDQIADNTSPDAWAASSESDRGSWMTFTRTGSATNGSGDPTQYHEFIVGLLDAGEFLIDDISVVQDPGTPSARELIQNGDFSSGTAAAWRLRGNHRRFEVIDDPDEPGNKVLRVTATGASEHMHNCVETTLKDGASYVTISGSSDYRIQFRARWLSGSNQLNSRLYFNRLPRTDILPIADPHSGGTPGAPNSGAVPNIGPTFTDAIHRPAVPAPGEAATITAQLSDPHGIESAVIFYSVDGGPFQQAPMAGADGQFAGAIPGQAAGAKAQFYIETRDDLGAVSRFPAAGPDSRALILWDDGIARLEMGSVRPNNFRIIMTGADAAFMHTVTEVMSNDRLECTVVWNERDVYYGCGVRLKGSQRGRAKAVRVGFNVRFPADRLFLGRHKTVAVDRSGAGDQFSQKEILLKHAINHAGDIPGMYDDLVWAIQPRDGIASSAMLLKSRFDDEWLDNQFENGGDGRFFEYELIYYPNTTTTGGPEGLKLPNPDSVTGVAMRNQAGDDKELYRYHWQLENNRDADDFSGLIEMLTAMGLSGDAYRSALEEKFDVDNWLRTFAVQALGGVGDNYASGSQHNALFYIRPTDGKAMYFPWDMDFTFNQSATSGVTNNGDLNRMLGASPAYQRLYYGHLLDIIDTTFNTQYLTRWANHYSGFLPSENLAGFLSYIDTRAAHVAGLAGSAVPNVPYRVTTPDGQAVSGATAVITGDAWIDVRELRLAGSPVPLAATWLDSNSWEAAIPVLPGANTYTIEAIGFDGSVIGSDTVEIIGDGSVVPADASSLAISEVMYSPSAPSQDEIAAGFDDGDDFEFIELVNISPNQTVDLTGAEFSDGISLVLPPVTLAPGARMVLAGNAAAFIQRYGFSAAAAYQNPDDTNKLSNAGERILLRDAFGAPIADFDFGDGPPWPASANGDGYSLIFMTPGQRDPRAPESWRSSAAIGGNPGSSDAISIADWSASFGGVSLFTDEDSDGLAGIIEYAAGTDPTRPSAMPVVVLRFENTVQLVFRQQIGADEITLSAESLPWTAAPDHPVYHGRLHNMDGTESVSFGMAADLAAPSHFFRFAIQPVQ